MPRLYIPKFKLWHPEYKEYQASAGGFSASKKSMASKGGSASSGQRKDAEPCDWQGDRASPELDNLAHECAEAQRTPRPDEVCDWKGDVAEPELNDLAHEYIETQESSGPGECGWNGDVAEPELDDLGPDHMPKHPGGSKPNESRESAAELVTEEPALHVSLPKYAIKPPKKEPQKKESREESPLNEKGSTIIDQIPVPKFPTFSDVIRQPDRPRQELETTPLVPVNPQEDESSAQVFPGLPFKIPGLSNIKIPGLPELPFKVPGLSSEDASGLQTLRMADASPEPEISSSAPESLAPAEEHKPQEHKNTKKEKAKKEQAKEKAKKEKAKEKQDKAREKKVKERAEKERKTKEKAARKAKEKEDQEREKREKRAKKDKKTNNHDGPPPPLPPGAEMSAAAESERTTEEQQARNEAIDEVKKKLRDGWDGLPSVNDLADSICKRLPGKQEGKPAGEKAQEDVELCTGHQFLETLEKTKNLENLTKKVQIVKEKDAHRQGMDGVLDEPSDYPSKPPTASLCTSGIDQTVVSSSDKGIVKVQPIESSSKTASSSLQSVLQGAKSCSLDCGHPESNTKCPSQPTRTFNPHCSKTKSDQQQSQKLAPGMLKRASCLCGALPLKPSDYAEYDTPVFATPALATTSEKNNRPDGSYF